MRLLCISIILTLSLSGCASNAIPTQRCSTRLMLPAKSIVDLKAGDDLTERYAELRRDSGKDKSQIRGLQTCVTAIYGK